MLQSGVNVGVIFAMLAGSLLANLPCRTVFLVGVLPALVVLWIRRAVSEPRERREARNQPANAQHSGTASLFRGAIRRTTILTMLVCGFRFSAHWAFLFWFSQHLRNLPELAAWSGAERTRLASGAMIVVIAASMAGNFIAAAVARGPGYRRTIAAACLLYFLCLCAAYYGPLGHAALIGWLVPIGMCQGLFALFTMYLPPLFPTLLRTTGAGFCFNSGRIAAAVATVFFGLSSAVCDYRIALLCAGTLFLPAAVLVLLLSEPDDEGEG